MVVPVNSVQWLGHSNMAKWEVYQSPQFYLCIWKTKIIFLEKLYKGMSWRSLFEKGFGSIPQPSATALI